MRHNRMRTRQGVAIAAAVLAGAGVDFANTSVATAAITSQAFNLVPVTESLAGPSFVPPAVKTGDTFSFAVAGFTNAGGGAFVIPPLSSTFGTTQVLAGPSYDPNVTVTSSETIGLLTTTDTITVSVPTSFDPNLTVGGNPINQLQLDVGGYNGITDHVDFSLSIDPATLTTAGSTTYNTGSGSTVFPLTPGDTLFNNNASIALIEGVSVGATGNASNFNFNSFTVTATYATPVPEPMTLGLIGLSAFGTFRRNRRRPTSE